MKVIYETKIYRELVNKTEVDLRKKFHDELERQDKINQKLKLVIDLNQMLKINIFKIFNAFIDFNKLVIKNN